MSRRIKKRRENKTPYSRLHNLTVNAVRMLIPFCDVLPIVTPEFPIIIVIFLLSYLYLFFDSAIARAGMTALRSIIRGIELIVAIEDTRGIMVSWARTRTKKRDKKAVARTRTVSQGSPLHPDPYRC